MVSINFLRSCFWDYSPVLKHSVSSFCHWQTLTFSSLHVTIHKCNQIFVIKQHVIINECIIHKSANDPFLHWRGLTYTGHKCNQIFIISNIVFQTTKQSDMNELLKCLPTKETSNACTFFRHFYKKVNESMNKSSGESKGTFL